MDFSAPMAARFTGLPLFLKNNLIEELKQT